MIESKKKESKKRTVVGKKENIRFSVLPQEIIRFLNQKGGRTLLLKGEPGTGKTLLTLRLLNSASKSEREVLYVSTRMDEKTINQMYIKDYLSLDKTNLLDLSNDPFDLPTDIDFPFESLTLDSFIEWISSIAEVNSNIIIAFDSWELIYKYISIRSDQNIGPNRLINQISKTAREQNVNIILVSETVEKSKTEYIVDGVIELQAFEDSKGRTRRELVFEKLRGVRIDNRVKPFTLKNGRFSVITPTEISHIRHQTSKENWKSTQNSKTQFSTGIYDMDQILDGGYNRGSIVHLELGGDLSRDAWNILTLPIIRNFISNKMGTSAIPPRESSPGLLQNDLSSIFSEKNIKKYFKIFNTYTSIQNKRENKNNTKIEKNNSSINKRLKKENEYFANNTKRFSFSEYISEIEDLREKSNGPILHIISMDTIQSDSEKLGNFANYISLHNDLSILITKPGNDLESLANRVADMHFCLERIDGSILLCGENPLTPLLGFKIDTAGKTQIMLEEIV